MVVFIHLAKLWGIQKCKAHRLETVFYFLCGTCRYESLREYHVFVDEISPHICPWAPYWNYVQ